MIRLCALVVAVLAMAVWSEPASAQVVHRGGGTFISVGFGNAGFGHWSGYPGIGWGSGWGYAYPITPIHYHSFYHRGFYGGGYYYRPPIYVPGGYYRCW